MHTVQSQPRKALNILSQVLEVVPTQRESLLCTARIYYDVGRYGKAMAAIRTGVAAFPNDPLFHVYHADVLNKLRDFAGALRSYRLALRLMRESGASTIETTKIINGEGETYSLKQADLDVRIAVALYGKGERATACNKLTEIVHKNPTHCAALLAAGRGLIDQGKRAEAMRIFMNALIASPNDADARVAITEAIQAPGGVGFVRSELTQSPSLSAAYAFLASVVLEHGAMAEGAALFRCALDADPARMSALLPLVHASELAQLHDTAVRDVAEYCRRNKKVSRLANTHAHAHSRILIPPARLDSVSIRFRCMSAII
jgi:Flp pilus assembly protein TadD